MCSKSFHLVLLLLLVHIAWSQRPCNITISGKVIDESTRIPLEYASIYINELNKGIVSNINGAFAIEEICEAEYHIEVSHIGCEPQTYFLKLYRDTFFTIELHHHTEILNEVLVHGDHTQSTVQSVQSVNKEEAHRNANKNLADLLETISGVSLIKNGAGVSKPVIHGMYGNRITVLNNGMVQAGQQWGNDHAPEIDPFISDRINVIKGVSSLAYGGNGLGSIVLVDQSTIEEDPHVHGLINYIFQSNGRGHTLNSRFSKYKNNWSWKFDGTCKFSGDHSAPGYFLTNTGKREWNGGLQINRRFSSEWKTDLILSTFNTNLGILRGSHIGNVTDLENALDRSVPFFTDSAFSYTIQAPRQEVHHHLVKLSNTWNKNDRNIFSFNYGLQLNDRKEYDVRRGERSAIPSLSLLQYSHLIEGKWHHEVSDSWHLKSGAQLTIIQNTNSPGTGILPLIPNYVSLKPGMYGIVELLKERVRWEAGGRIDFNKLNVANISRANLNEIEYAEHQFLNLNIATGIRYNLNEKASFNYNLGLAYRSPEINELYSNGLHQGVSGIEEGNRNLTVEKSLKNIVSLDFNVNKKFIFQALAYHQYIADYIYLRPEKEFRLTIRGAFPVYTYQQTNAVIKGLDFTGTYELNNKLTYHVQYSYIRGNDVLQDQGLVYIPPNTFKQQLEFLVKDSPKRKNTSLSLQNKIVSRQRNISENQDFLSPPAGYALWNLDFHTTLTIRHSQVSLSCSIENLSNTSYRDYLNRLRYFADETGRSIHLRIGYKF